jgi:predicted PhzF superfamily epimerase YddE/YHI9
MPINSYGINEDPVTGSAHCALAPYWFQKLEKNKESDELMAFQASPRGGILRLSLSDEGTRVVLTGHSITTMKMRILA